MTAYDTYLKYIAIQLHFSGNYDYFKYSGKVNASPDSFNLRKDKYFFHRLSKKVSDEDMELFLAANFYEKSGIWVGNLLDENCKTIFLQHKKILESLSYHYEQELDSLFSTSGFTDLFNCKDKQIPLIVSKLKRKEISVETFCILARDLKLYGAIDSKIDDDFVWPKIKKSCEKLYPFFKLGDNKAFKLITVKKLTEYYDSGNSTI